MTAFLYYFILLSQKYGTQTCAVFFYAPKAGLEPQGGARDEKTHRVFPERTSDLRSRSRRMRRRRIRCPIRGANPLPCGRGFLFRMGLEPQGGARDKKTE